MPRPPSTARWVRALLVHALAGTIVLGPGASRGETDDTGRTSVAPALRALARDPGEDAAALELDLDAEASLPAPASHDPFTLRTSASATESADLRTLLATGERWRLVRFDAVALSHRVDTRLTAYGRVAHVPSVEGAIAPLHEDPMSLGIKGELGDFELGAEYRSLGKRLERVMPQGRKDQQGSEVWLARRLGLVRVRLSQAELSDNVDANPVLPRTTRVQTAVTAELLPGGWPGLGLTYATGNSERAWLARDALGQPPERQAFHAVTGAVHHDGAWWGVRLSSTYSSGRDTVHVGHESVALYQDVTVWLRLLESLTLTSSTAAGHERSSWSRISTDTTSMWLTMSYAPPHSPWHAWGLAGGTVAGTSDRSFDARTLSLVGGLGWDIGGPSPGRSTLSLEAGYDRYLDRVFPDSSSGSVYALLLLTITSP